MKEIRDAIEDYRNGRMGSINSWSICDDQEICRCI